MIEKILKEATRLQIKAQTTSETNVDNYGQFKIECYNILISLQQKSIFWRNEHKSKWQCLTTDELNKNNNAGYFHNQKYITHCSEYS